MSNRTVLWLTIFVVICIIFLLILNSIPMIWTPQTEKYLKYNDVKGIAIEHNKKLYTLSFEQQNETIGYLNQSLPIENKKNNTNLKLPVSKIIIYQFGRPDLTIVPLEYTNHNLIFSSPEWNPNGMMMDVSDGGFEKLLSKAHD